MAPTKTVGRSQHDNLGPGRVYIKISIIIIDAVVSVMRHRFFLIFHLVTHVNSAISDAAEAISVQRVGQ